MTNLWDERKKALEEDYFRKENKKKLENLKENIVDCEVKTICKDRCPKCGAHIVPMTFQGVPLDRCEDCGGVWLGPNDLIALSQRDAPTWFDKWFKAEELERLEQNK